MSAHARIAVTERERYIQQAEDQMRAFEQREAAFRKQEREERAAQLKLPLKPDELH